MKKLLLSLFTIGMLQICMAQKAVDTSVKFIPPVIKKNKPVSKKKEQIKFTPPTIVKDDTTTSIKKSKPGHKKN